MTASCFGAVMKGLPCTYLRNHSPRLHEQTAGEEVEELGDQCRPQP